MLARKHAGAYYTPDAVASSLVKWALRSPTDRLLDPSCGDGQFVAAHHNSVGVEQDIAAARMTIARAPWALVHEGDFFTWASNTNERFECAAGNPPFIRYQTFKGPTRERALGLAARAGVHFNGLASSWAPFLAVTASLLKPGGRMAFVVPAEIGHAPYAAPLLEYLVASFGIVHVTAVRDKLFPELAEDCWLLFADQYGSSTREIRLSKLDRFKPTAQPPRSFLRVPVNEWRNQWKQRLRSYLLPDEARHLYAEVANDMFTCRLADIASVGIGYVSGANDFFHLRPSIADRLGIPNGLLFPTVRNGRALPPRQVTNATVEKWYRDDDPILLLRLPKTRLSTLPIAVRRYLDTEEARAAQQGYKCRNRDPWFSVPDVQVPDFFLSYMSGVTPALVRNVASCTCTNSVHSVRLRDRRSASTLAAVWSSSFVQLSCEIEGHPLGGGMLKLEPREAGQIMLPAADLLGSLYAPALEEGIATMREWRHL